MTLSEFCPDPTPYPLDRPTVTSRRHRAFSASTSEKGELHTLRYVMTVYYSSISVYILITYYGVYPQKYVKIFLPLRLYYL